MATKPTVLFDELTKLASDFVTTQRGVWDHAAWVDLLARAQAKGIEFSEDMQASLGDLLEAMKRYHGAVASTDDVEGAMTRVFDNSAAFVKRQQGVWGHAEWEDFVRTAQDNVRAWSDGTEAYVGGVLESLKEFYDLFPPVPAAKPVPAAQVPPATEALPSTQPTRPMGRQDDLTAIAGLGPALARKLNQEGIVSYAQLAALSDAEIAHLERNVLKSSGRFKRNDWVGQARRLSEAG